MVGTTDSTLFEAYQVVGILETHEFDLFSDAVVAYSLNGMNLNDDIRSETIHRVYVSELKDVESLNKKIETSTCREYLTYSGGQFALYVNLRNIAEFASTIFLTIAIPVVVTLLCLWAIVTVNFFEKQRRLFSQMLLLGYRFRQTVTFVFWELLFCGLAALMVAVIVGPLCVLAFQKVLVMLLIDFVLDVKIIFITLGALMAVLCGFLALIAIPILQKLRKISVFDSSRTQ